MTPANLEELQAAVADCNLIRIRGSRSKEDFEMPYFHDPHEVELSTSKYSGIIQYDPDDQVVVVRSGTLIEELQEALRSKSQCLPLPSQPPLNGISGTVGGMIASNLPHGWSGRVGSIRDWLLGLSVVRADGTLAKSGSKVVKSVAGYDVHKMFVGSRGTIGVIADVTLKVFPVRALPPEPECGGYDASRALWIQRTLRSHFAAAVTAMEPMLIGADAESSTLWGHGQGIRLQGDWVLRSHCGELNIEIRDRTAMELMRRAKVAFDPSSKLNAGALGFL